MDLEAESHPWVQDLECQVAPEAEGLQWEVLNLAVSVSLHHLREDQVDQVDLEVKDQSLYFQPRALEAAARQLYFQPWALEAVIQSLYFPPWALEAVVQSLYFQPWSLYFQPVLRLCLT